MTRSWMLAASAAIVVLGIAGCGGDDEEAAPPAGRQTETAPPDRPAAAGRAIFEEQGCGSCHTLAAAEASGRIGPNLDEALKGQSKGEIRRSIVDPNAEISEGFNAGVMPTDFRKKLSDKQLSQLVDFLAASAGP